MSGNRFLADTNTFIYLLDKHPLLEPLLESEWFFSFITEIELLGNPEITRSEIKQVKGVLAACNKVVHVETINELTIALKQQYKIKLPDALIAATALHQQIDLFLLEP